MVLSHFYDGLSATVPAPLHWDKYIEPMQYSGMGVFRAPKLRSTMESAEFLPSSKDVQSQAWNDAGADASAEQPEDSRFLALVNGPDGWQWAKLPKSFDIMSALKSGRSLFHDEVADEQQDVHEQAGDELAYPQDSDLSLQQGDDSQLTGTDHADNQMPISQHEPHENAIPSHPTRQHADFQRPIPQHEPEENAIATLPARQHADFQRPIPQYEQEENAIPTLPTRHAMYENAIPTRPARLCDALPERRAHNYSYADHFINGNFASREVATRCIGGTCYSISHDVFPDAKGLLSYGGAAENNAWAPMPRRTGTRVSTALHKAFSDMSDWLTNGMQENCGGQNRAHTASRTFSHGYVFSNANGDARIDEQETHCRDGHCVKVLRHLVPRQQQHAEVDAGDLPRPSARLETNSEEPRIFGASLDASPEAAAPQSSENLLPPISQAMI